MCKSVLQPISLRFLASVSSLQHSRFPIANKHFISKASADSVLTLQSTWVLRILLKFSHASRPRWVVLCRQILLLGSRLFLEAKKIFSRAHTSAYVLTCDLVCILIYNSSDYNWYQYFNEQMSAAGLSSTEIGYVKIWSSDYPKVCDVARV
jgi:hypothetical protein